MGAGLAVNDKVNRAYLKRVNEHQLDKQRVAEDTQERAERKLARFKKGKRPPQVPRPTQIEPNLWLGNFYDALQRHHFKYIVNCTTVAYDLDGIQLSFMNIEDDESENIGSHLPRQTTWISGCIQAGGSVLVHCEHGVSRSATVIIAYIMKERSMTAIDALQHVRNLRPCVCPNENFLEALCDWERACGIKVNRRGSSLKQLKSVISY
ncbi:hypothetical protein TrST_g5968 [Triparma strigata]|uniref:protein-tyrosine-phosphatase n=1 Tax=Triparma strigata TaxID=1606541 RepID=A0A9W7C2G1_9STRA|nr:hypothetical protein TrST_g5968 [Triparma strigata]